MSIHPSHDMLGDGTEVAYCGRCDVLVTRNAIQMPCTKDPRDINRELNVDAPAPAPEEIRPNYYRATVRFHSLGDSKGVDASGCTVVGIECFDMIDALGLDFYGGNALKYLWRAGRKTDALEDLRKARTYLNRMIEERERET